MNSPEYTDDDPRYKKTVEEQELEDEAKDLEDEYYKDPYDGELHDPK